VITVRSAQEINQPQVNTNGGQALFRLWSGIRKFHRETGKPLATIFGDREGFDLGFLGDLSVQYKSEISDLGNGDLFRRALGVLGIGQAVPLTTLLELRKARCLTGFHSAKKGFVGLVKPVKDILKNLRVDGLEPRTLLFELREGVLLNTIRKALGLYLVSILTLLQRPVVQMTTHRELILKIRDLRFRRIYPIFVRLAKRHFFFWLNLL
jgi:hypothetical protein